MGLIDSAKRFAGGLVQNAQNTSLVKRLQSGVEAGLQQYGYNRQQGVPLGRGGSGNSVVGAILTGEPIPGKTQAQYDYSQAKSTGVTPPPIDKKQPIVQPKQPTEQPIQPAGSADQINMDQMYNVNGQMKSGRTIMAETGGTGFYGGG